MRKCFNSVLAFFACIIMLVIALSAQVKADGDYPEISPDNLSCRYGYNYLGTLEHGEIYQKIYNCLDDELWTFYMSDEEAIPYSYAADGQTVSNYIAARIRLSDFLSEEEIAEITNNFGKINEWDLIKYWFFNDSPIYYFCRNGSGAQGSQGYDSELGRFTDEITIIATTYLDGDTYEAINDYGSLQTREHVREVTTQKLHEYYDLTKNLTTTFEKEVAINEKISREAIYNHDDLYENDGHTYVGVFNEDKTVCEGYACAFEMICNYCGLECIYVDGELNNGVGHAWNAVKMGDDWYCVDVTWNDMDEELDDEDGYYVTSKLPESDVKGHFSFLNTPVSIFSGEKYFCHLVNLNHASEYPSFSDSEQFWNVYFVNQPASYTMGGTITSQQAQNAIEYIESRLEQGDFAIDLFAWDNYLTETANGESIADLINNFLQDYSERKGEEYNWVNNGQMYVYYTYTNFLGKGTGAHAFTRATMLFSKYVTDEEENEYWTHNVDGSGEGIVLTKYKDNSSGTIIFPSALDGKPLRGVMLSGVMLHRLYSRQMIIPDGVKIVGGSGYPNLYAYVIPESIEQIAYWYADAVYVPANTVFLSTSSNTTKIYGYQDTIAQRYASNNNLIFYDLTGKDIISNINISGFELPEIGTEIVPMEISQLSAGEHITITDISYEDVDSNLLDYCNCKVCISVQADDGYAITPNTLVCVNDLYAFVNNVDLENAVIEYYFNMPILELNESRALYEGKLRINHYLTIEENMYVNKFINPSYTWKRDGVIVEGQTNSSYYLDIDDIGTVITCEVQDAGRNGILVASTQKEISKKYRATPSGLSSSPESYRGANDGSIVSSTSSIDPYMWECSTDSGFSELLEVGWGAIENLSTGTYYVRYVEMEDTEASEAAEVVVGLGSIIDVTFRNNCSFGNDLSLLYAVAAEDLSDYENVRLVCQKRKYNALGDDYTMSAPITITGVVSDIGGVPYYQFTYANIAAKEISDEISAVLYADKDGITYESEPFEYSIKAYAENRLENSSNETYKTLIVDMLNYGAQAQIHFNYNTSHLANAGLDDEYLALGTAEMPELTDAEESVETPGATVNISRNNVEFGNNIGLLFAMEISEGQSLENLRLEISYESVSGGEKSVSIPSSKFEYASEIQAYTGRITTISATDLGTTVTAKVYDGETLVSNVKKYSIESYARNRLANSTSDSYKELIRMLMKYGKAAKNHFGID